jgi:predicted CXXCH cytochrome family protein
MRRTLVLAWMLFGMVSFAAAQIARPTTDVLGAHLNYGRGCTACHSPHSGAAGNGTAKSPTALSTGMTPLWGEDASSLYGKTIATGGGKFVEVLPASMSAGTPDVSGMLTCLG